jgi:hypothetical protein
MDNNIPLGVTMRLLLLNNNPAVSRLIKLSVDKAGYEMDEFEDYGLVPLKVYDVIMVDNESYEEEELVSLCEHSSCQYVVYICQRGSKKPDFVNVSLEKPFLPTDFLLLLDKIKNVLESLKQQEHPEYKDEAIAPIEEQSAQNVFDIDAIDTFGVESLGNEALRPFEELSLDEQSSEDLELLDVEETDLELPRFDSHEEEIETLDLASIKTEEDADEDEVPHTPNAFDFEEEPTSFEPLEEENAPCILDRDDINEVKQLLDESDEEETKTLEALNFESPAFEELSLEEENDTLLDEIVQETQDIQEEEEEEQKEEMETLELPLEEEMQDALLEESSAEETQEALINDFEECVEEDCFEEESIASLSDLALSKSLCETDFESIDDLNENAIKKAFGERVDEEPRGEAFDFQPSDVSEQDTEVIRGEIQSTIARSLSGLAQSDVLREALRGMRINISITFDEKN